MENELATMVSNLINNLGFPIAVCFVCFKYIDKMQTLHRDDMNEAAKMHKEEVDKLSAALDEIKMVIQKLLDRLYTDN